MVTAAIPTVKNAGVLAAIFAADAVIAISPLH